MSDEFSLEELPEEEVQPHRSNIAKPSKSIISEESKNPETMYKGVEVTQVVVQTAPAIKLPNGKVLSDIHEILAWICDNIIHIRRAVA